MEIVIRKADAVDSGVLTELTFKSKRYWNYPQEYMKLWEQDLTVTDEYVRQNVVYAAEINGKIGGYYVILENKEDYLLRGMLVQKGFWLDNFFILPEFIGHGIGANLLAHAKNTCKNMGCSKLYIFSDPHAQGFYLKQGARFIQDCPSSIEGRTIPMLELAVQNDLQLQV